MKTANEIVNYLVRHYQEITGQIEENLLPPKIDDLVEDMGKFLEIRLEEDTPYKTAWDDFADQPEANSSYLAGILEALFEAQPGVRERVDGFMRQITAIEVKRSDHDYTEEEIDSDLKTEPGGLTPNGGNNSAILADKKVEKNPPAYLYGNERQDFESSRQAAEPKPFMIGKNAQVVFLPHEAVPFPRSFDFFLQLVNTSPNLGENAKQRIQTHLETIYSHLSGKQPYKEDELATAFEAMWEEAPSYADALVRSLQNDVDALIVDARDFVIQLHTPHD